MNIMSAVKISLLDLDAKIHRCLPAWTHDQLCRAHSSLSTGIGYSYRCYHAVKQALVILAGHHDGCMGGELARETKDRDASCDSLIVLGLSCT